MFLWPTLQILTNVNNWGLTDQLQYSPGLGFKYWQARPCGVSAPMMEMAFRQSQSKGKKRWLKRDVLCFRWHWCYFFYLYQEQKVQLIDIISTVPTPLAFQNRQLQARLTSTIQCMALDLKILTITIDRLTFFWSFLRRLVLQVFVTSFLCMRVLISFYRRHSSQTF